jgi:hypothetical protein
MNTNAKAYANGVIVAVLCACLGACGKPASNSAKNWIPNSVGGPIEIRPLPARAKLVDDYREWISASTSGKVRLYEVTIHRSSQQIDLESQVYRANTPLGGIMTDASFIYSNGVDNMYRFEWGVPGKQSPKLLKVDDRPKKFLVTVIQMQDIPLPRLQIVAIEGVPTTRQLVAVQETTVP